MADRRRLRLSGPGRGLVVPMSPRDRIDRQARAAVGVHAANDYPGPSWRAWACWAGVAFPPAVRAGQARTGWAGGPTPDRLGRTGSSQVTGARPVACTFAALRGRPTAPGMTSRSGR